MSKRRRKGAARAPTPPPKRSSQGYLVPAIVLIVVVGALIAVQVTRKPVQDELPTPGEPEAPEDVWQADPEMARLKQDAIVILQRVVDRWARNETEPWLLNHGLLAWGPRHLTRGDEPAGTYLIDHALTTRTHAGRDIQVFPSDDPGGARIDAHFDQTIKTLIEMGINDPRLPELARGAQWRFEYDAGNPDAPFPDANEVPWSAQAFCQSAPAGEDSFVTSSGARVDLRVMTRQLVEALEKESEFLDEIRLAGGTTYEKRRQGIFRYTCGGTHLFMGAEACVVAGFGDQDLTERLAYQMDLLFWRMRREIEAVDNALTQAPQMAPLLVEQRMKYLGHFLEAEAKAELHGTFVPSEHHRQELVYAKRALYRTVQQLQEMGVFDRLDTFHDEQYEYYLFTAGDACHALYALNLQDQLEAQRHQIEYVPPDLFYPLSQETDAETP